MNRVLRWMLLGIACAAGPISDVRGQDLVLLVKLERQVTENQFKQDISDALIATKIPDARFNIRRIEPRVFGRLAKMMKLDGAASNPPTEGALKQLEGSHWQLDLGGEFPPKFLWLKWRSSRDPKTERLESFSVLPAGENDPAATVQQLDRYHLVIRPADDWEMLGWGLGPGGEADQPKFIREWPQSARTYALTFPGLPGGETTRQSFIAALKMKIPELLQIDAPERPVRLVSVDLNPEVLALGGAVFKNLYLLRFDRLRDRPAAQDCEVWAVFPLTAEQRQAVLDKVNGGELTNKQAAEWLHRESSFPAVEVEAGRSAQGLPRNWPSPTGAVRPGFATARYVVPAIPTAEGKVQEYLRALELSQTPPPTGEAWMVVMYIFRLEGDSEFPWRAIDLDNTEKVAYAREIKMTNLEEIRRAIEAAQPPPKAEEK